MLKWLWISVVVIILDQVTKYLASTYLQFQIPEPVLPFFNLTLMYNTGAAFSFLSDASGWQRWFFVALAIIISGVIVIWLKKLKSNDLWLAIALAFILGGAIGNVIDRMWLGYVVDFIQVYYDRWYFPAFNIADSAITVGTVLVIIDGLSGLKKSSDD